MSRMTISEIALKFGVSPRAIRFYESKGLLFPLRERGRRIYLEEDQQHLAMIVKARKLGFTVADISLLLRASDGSAPMHGLALTREKCAEQIIRLEARVRELNDALVDLRQMIPSEDVPAKTD